MTVLRQGLLDSRAVAVSAGVPRVVVDGLSGLGARVEQLDSGLDEDRVTEWATAASPLHALVFDAGPAFGDGGQAQLGEALERAWVATRGVATGALIPAGAGKVLLIAPRSGAGAFAAAARAALENLARTLSVEWARYGVSVVAVAPGPRSSDAELAELVCFWSRRRASTSAAACSSCSYGRLSRPSRGCYGRVRSCSHASTHRSQLTTRYRT